MIADKFTITKKIENRLKPEYIALAYPIKYKDDIKRENEVTLNDKKDVYYLRLSYEKDDFNKVQSKIELPEDYRFCPLPYLNADEEQERSVLYLSGSSGGGKSFLANMYCDLYHKFYPNNKIYFITSNNWQEDKSLNKDLYTFLDAKEFISNFMKPEIIADFATTTEYNNSMFVFDDIGMFEKLGKNENKAVWAVIDTILENKRKNMISIIVISHIATNYRQTSLLVREAKQYVIFGKNQQTLSDRFLKTYLALNTKQLNYIIGEDSNWVLIDMKRKIVLSQHNALFLKNIE